MRRALLLAIGWLLCCGGSLGAVDLEKVDRTSPKLPELQSGAAQYCLLVFGPEARDKVWLVHDGDRLYVDRNGNGDLTEPGETVPADQPDSRPGIYHFRVGDISTSAGVHKDLRVGWQSVDHMKDDSPEIKARLAHQPDFRGCMILLDVAMPGFQGSGIDGRVTCITGVMDVNGLLAFAPRPEEAPIVYFGGPWQISFYGKHAWRIGKKDEAILSVSTRGLGPGTTADVGYEGVVPSGLKPVVEVTWPAAPGETARQGRYELDKRCCTVNLYGEVPVPADIRPGVASVKISLPSWPGAKVASTNHQVQVLPALPGLTRKPVSSRLTRKLEHEHKDGNTVAIEFSPDGKRLIAGDYPGGLVHVWDVGSGKRLATFAADAGYRSTHNYFVVSDDWKHVFAPTNTRGKFERIERGGKSMYRVSYDDSIRVWDLESGRLLDNWKTDPPRGALSVGLWPDHKWLLAYEETPGEFESIRPRALSLWEIKTGQHRQLFAHQTSIETFSNDGKQAIVLARDDDPAGASLDLYHLEEWKPAGPKIPLGPLQRCHSAHFLDQAAMLVGTIATRPSREDYANATYELKFWKSADLSELWSYALDPGETPSGIWPTPNQDALLLTTTLRGSNSGRLLRVNVATHDVRVLFDQPRQLPRTCAFNPGAQWFAFAIQEFPESSGTRDIPLDEVPQPHLHVRDIATGDLLEDLIAPPAYMNSLAFSPDGNTLATSGQGAVLLWDFSDPPDSDRPDNAAPAAVGQPFTAAGTLVDGTPLDWSAYRDKVVLVTYWATWCQPCVAEIPETRRLYESLHKQGFEVLAINVDKDRDVLKRFLDSEKLPWQVVYAPAGQEDRLDHPLARRYGVESLPKTFLIDRQGKIAAIDVHGAKLAAQIDKLLKSDDLLSPK